MPKVRPINAAMSEDQHNSDSATHSAIETIVSGFKFQIASFIANLFVAGTLCYVGMNVVTWLIVGATMLTGSAFLAFMIAFIGYAIVFIGSMAVGSYVAKYIAQGTALDDMKAVKDVCVAKLVDVRAWFDARVANF